MEPEVSYESTQIKAFAALVEDGTYSEGFSHSPQAQQFFGDVISRFTGDWAEDTPVRVLDCGCGNGAWLDFVARSVRPEIPIRMYGFDLTPGMVEIARRRLCSTASMVTFQVGNILSQESYVFANDGAQFDLIFTYDVVQQLPRKLQYKACETMVNHLSAGGIAVIFDNDCHSKFGRKMGRKKFLTRYFRLNLVPMYYCNAKYPPLLKFSERISQLPGFMTEIVVSEDGMKRAMIVHRLAEAETL